VVRHHKFLTSYLYLSLTDICHKDSTKAPKTTKLRVFICHKSTQQDRNGRYALYTDIRQCRGDKCDTL